MPGKLLLEGGTRGQLDVLDSAVGVTENFIDLALVKSGPLALVLTPIASVGAVATPALQGMLSRRVAADAQGELQGVIASVNALAAILSPLVMTTAFAAFTADGAAVHFPGAPFVLAAILLGLATLVIRRTPRAS